MGIPAHITVIAPFLAPGEIGPAVLGELSRLFGGVPRFRFRLARTAWFGERSCGWHRRRARPSEPS